MKYLLDQPVSGSIGTAKYQCTIEWRNGKFVSDEPVRSGGADAGPDPYTLMLSSLASCTLVTLRMYIDRKGWDIGYIGINVNMYHARKDDKTIMVMDRDIRYTQTLTDEQRTRLNEIATNCPISKILEGDIQVRTYTYNDSHTDNQLSYTNGEITVVWKPDICKHAGRCATQLPGVFNVNERPWVNMQGATTEAIRQQVLQCPTGALSAISNADLPLVARNTAPVAE